MDFGFFIALRLRNVIDLRNEFQYMMGIQQSYKFI